MAKSLRFSYGKPPLLAEAGRARLERACTPLTREQFVYFAGNETCGAQVSLMATVAECTQ
ncbi:hypothetical protein ACFYUV_29280 [Nonomuraea sp. NPDC003560]|uniref:hypothetical protein n=1 Tax=Nonomuraea sp. NPDC003560 TaxID=3364341 RepID=UPI0036883F82